MPPSPVLENECFRADTFLFTSFNTVLYQLAESDLNFDELLHGAAQIANLANTDILNFHCLDDPRFHRSFTTATGEFGAGAGECDPIQSAMLRASFLKHGVKNDRVLVALSGFVVGTERNERLIALPAAQKPSVSCAAAQKS